MIKNIPKRRFKGFNDEWEDKKLGEIGTVLTGNTPSTINKENWSDDSVGYVWITPSDINKLKINNSERKLTKTGWKKSRQIPINSVLITSIASIGKNAINTVSASINQQINAIIPKNNDYYFILNSMEKEVKRFSSEASLSATSIVNKSEFQKFEITIPSLPEQQKIGAFFQKLDKQISLYDQKVNKLNNLKKSYLNRMFLKDNMLYPELRFKGFNDEWEEKKLGEFAKITMGESPSSLNYTNNPSDFILIQGNADLKKGRVIPRVWTTQITKKAFKKDIILTVRAPVGDVGITDYDVVIGRGVAAINGNNFLFHLLTMWKDSGFWNRLSTGSTFDSINLKDIQKLNLKIPSLLEQQRIGSFFSKLDTLINLYQDKYHKLKDLKKAYLNEMFVN